jgi:hypothetical protein
MPAKEIMPKFRAGELHSGSPSGPIVKKPKQAKAILLSYLRKEGHDIPEKKEPRMVTAFKKANR